VSKVQKAWAAFGLCVVGFLVLAAVSPEEGGLADALWVASMIIAAVGLVALAMAVRLSMRRDSA